MPLVFEMIKNRLDNKWIEVASLHMKTFTPNYVAGSPGGGTPSLRVSRYGPRFCPPFSASGQSFCPPKFDNVYHFIQILLGPVSKPPNFHHVDDLFAHKIDQIYNFIQILLGPILNFEPRTPTDFYPECPPRAGSLGLPSSLEAPSGD